MPEDKSFWDIFRNISFKSVLNDPNTGPVAQASGWVSDPKRGIVQESPNSEGAQRLAKSLTEISTIPLSDLGVGFIGEIPKVSQAISKVTKALKNLTRHSSAKNLIGNRIGAVVDQKYLNLPPLEQDKLIFDDFLEGRRLASDFFSSDVKKATDLYNKQLAKSLGYEFVENSDAVARVNKPMIRQQPNLWLQRKGHGGFYLNRDLAKEGSLGRYKPNSDEMILSGLGDIQEVSMHEHLHRGNFGEAPWHPTTSSSEYKALRSTDEFYQKLTDDIIDLSKPYDSYIGTPGEAATNLLEIGRRANLKLGQSYPGDEKAIEIFKEIIKNDKLKGSILDKFKWKQEPKKIWDALTGAYYAIPMVGLIYEEAK